MDEETKWKQLLLISNHQEYKDLLFLFLFCYFPIVVLYLLGVIGILIYIDSPVAL